MCRFKKKKIIKFLKGNFLTGFNIYILYVIKHIASFLSFNQSF